MDITYTNVITTEQYNALMKSVGWKERNEQQMETGLKNSIVFVANVDSTPVGVTRIVTDGGYVAIIVDVVVRPEFQGKGIGKGLVQKAVDYFNDRLQEGWYFNVSLMAAKGREEFYEQFGFVRRPSDKFGCGMTLWLEKKEDKP